MTTESPCIGVCQLAEGEAVCVGCHRTMSEIASWHRFTEAEKLLVLTAIRERQTACTLKTSGPQRHELPVQRIT